MTISEPGPTLAARGLTRVFTAGDAPVHALRGVDLALEPGSITAIMGLSGCGKSTLLHLLGVRERMRELGVYRAIGLTPAQVTATGAAGVGLLALIAALVGVPLGLVVYRVLFNLIGSDLFGAAPEWSHSPPAWQLAVIVPGAMLVAALAATLPARRAGRLRVADVLRFE